jgi:hypothetical protein
MLLLTDATICEIFVFFSDNNFPIIIIRTQVYKEAFVNLNRLFDCFLFRLILNLVK